MTAERRNGKNVNSSHPAKSRYYYGIYLDRLKKNKKLFWQDSRFFGTDSQGAPE
jgi:hypothetical protein